MTRIACFDLGGSFIKFGVMEVASCKLLQKQSIAIPSDPRELDQAMAVLVEGINGIAPVGIALSLAGGIDTRTGCISAANVPAINGRNMAIESVACFGLPVVAVNDVHAYAAAEYRFGEGQGRKVMFAIILGSGVGGALMVDGRLVVGESGVAGEWGHVSILKTAVPNLPFALPRRRCNCGRWGCVNTIGGAHGLVSLHRDLHGKEVGSRAITEGFVAGDPVMQKTVAVWVELMAEPLAMICNVVDASIIPVGGGLGQAAAIIALLDCAVRQRIYRHEEHPIVVPARCGAEGGLLGVGLMAAEQLKLAPSSTINC